MRSSSTPAATQSTRLSRSRCGAGGRRAVHDRPGVLIEVVSLDAEGLLRGHRRRGTRATGRDGGHVPGRRASESGGLRLAGGRGRGEHPGRVPSPRHAGRPAYGPSISASGNSRGPTCSRLPSNRRVTGSESTTSVRRSSPARWARSAMTPRRPVSITPTVCRCDHRSTDRRRAWSTPVSRRRWRRSRRRDRGRSRRGPSPTRSSGPSGTGRGPHQRRPLRR